MLEEDFRCEEEIRRSKEIDDRIHLLLDLSFNSPKHLIRWLRITLYPWSIAQVFYEGVRLSTVSPTRVYPNLRTLNRIR